MNLMDTSRTAKSLKTFITLGILAVAAFGVAKGGQYAYNVYVGAEGEEQPKQVNVDTVSSNMAEVSWITDKETYGFVEYGSTSALGLVAQSANGEKATNHSVELKNLLPNTKYYFKIGSGEKTYGNGESGEPYNFVTEPSSGKDSGSAETTDSNVDTSDLTESGFSKYMYTNNADYDLNGDGEVNAIDYEIWQTQ